MSPQASPFDSRFYASLAQLQPASQSQFHWYQTALIALGALNYPEEIPRLYKLLLDKYIPAEAQMSETQKIREGLTKMCGIMGAAKVFQKAGSSLRHLATAVPPDLQDGTYHRASDTHETAVQRGPALQSLIYGNIPGYDLSRTLHAGPDYYHIVTELFYGHIFSFDGILNFMETEHAVVSALLGIDCPEQARNHMLAFLKNGGKQEELVLIRKIVERIAERGGVHLRRVADFETPSI